MQSPQVIINSVGFRDIKKSLCALQYDAKELNGFKTGKIVRIDPNISGKEMGFYFSIIENHWIILRIVVI